METFKDHKSLMLYWTNLAEALQYCELHINDNGESVQAIKDMIAQSFDHHLVKMPHLPGHSHTNSPWNPNQQNHQHSIQSNPVPSPIANTPPLILPQTYPYPGNPNFPDPLDFSSPKLEGLYCKVEQGGKSLEFYEDSTIYATITLDGGLVFNSDIGTKEELAKKFVLFQSNTWDEHTQWDPKFENVLWEISDKDNKIHTVLETNKLDFIVDEPSRPFDYWTLEHARKLWRGVKK